MVSEKSKAILLLTAYLPGRGKSENKPLSTGEYNRLASWLLEQSLSPEQLLEPGLHDLLLGFDDLKISRERIEKLLERGAALALALDKWESAGIWVINRGDAQYPALLKRRLKQHCPPIFFGCGNPRILTTPGIGVVGSRKASEADLTITRLLGGLIAGHGHTVVSGAAKGVDETSMLGALEAGGTATGMVADGLLKMATSRKFREYLMKQDLVLLSPFSPDARFNVGNAMARNKLIYTQSEAAIVVHSGLTGGTIAGAEENIKHNWVPVWVKQTDDPEAGNDLIVKKGGQFLPLDTAEWLGIIFTGAPRQKEKQGNLFQAQEPARGLSLVAQIPRNISDEQDALFELFLEKVQEIASERKVSIQEVSKTLHLTEAQTEAWLLRAERAGLVEKDAREDYLVKHD